MSDAAPTMKRGWLARQQAAQRRLHRTVEMADVNAVRQAMIHGEEPPADAVARLAGAEPKPNVMLDHLQKRAAEAEVVEEAKKRGGRPRKTEG